MLVDFVFGEKDPVVDAILPYFLDIKQVNFVDEMLVMDATASGQGVFGDTVDLLSEELQVFTLDSLLTDFAGRLDFDLAGFDFDGLHLSLLGLVWLSSLHH